MSDLMKSIDAFVAPKLAAQRAYVDKVTALSDEQLQAITAVSTKEADAALSAVSNRLEEAVEAHPLGAHLAKVLGDVAADPFREINDRLWKVTADSRLMSRAQMVLSGPMMAMVFADMLSEEDREQATAPWREALGPDSLA